MRQTGNGRRLVAGLIALAVAACTTTYTEADYQETEAHHAREDRAAEQRRESEIADEGGGSGELIREAEDQAIMDSNR